MKLFAKPGCEWAEDRLIGLWCPVLTGRTDTTLLDCNLLTSNHGNLTGYTNLNLGWVGSSFGTVLNFDGSDDVVNVGNRSILSFEFTSRFTLSAWIRTTGSSGGIIGKRVSAGWYMSLEGANILGMVLQGTSSAIIVNSVASGISDGNWHLVQATYTGNSNASGISLFIDGRSVSTTTILNSAIGSMVNAIDVCLGSITTNAFRFSGQIGEVAVWNRVLNLGENQELYKLGLGGSWQLQPRRSRSYFAQMLTNYRNRSSRYLCFPG